MRKLLLTICVFICLLAVSSAGPLQQKHLAVIAATGGAVGEECSYTEKDDIYSGNNTTETGFGHLDTEKSIGFNLLATSSYNADRIKVKIKKIGSPTGTLYFYIYTPDNGGSEGPPDDRIATATTTIDVSTLTTDCADYLIDFNTSPASLSAAGSPYNIVSYFVPTFSDTNNDVHFCGDTYIGNSYGGYIREGTLGTTNDATNWSEYDANGQPVYTVYACE